MDEDEYADFIQKLLQADRLSQHRNAVCETLPPSRGYCGVCKRNVAKKILFGCQNCQVIYCLICVDAKAASMFQDKISTFCCNRCMYHYSQGARQDSHFICWKCNEFKWGRDCETLECTACRVGIPF